MIGLWTVTAIGGLTDASGTSLTAAQNSQPLPPTLAGNWGVLTNYFPATLTDTQNVAQNELIRFTGVHILVFLICICNRFNHSHGSIFVHGRRFDHC